MSEEALWTIEFETTLGWANGGVVVLETGRLFGGDSQYYYVGKYNYAQPIYTAQVRVTHYQGPLGTAWGDAAQTFDLAVRGNIDSCTDGHRDSLQLAAAAVG